MKLKTKIYTKSALEPREFWFDGYVTLYLGDKLPDNLSKDYRDLKIMFPKYRENVIGMREGQIREFTVSYRDLSITNTSDELYGKDLDYIVEFLEMLMDARYEPIIELSPTHPVVLLAAAIVIVLSYEGIRRNYHTKVYQKARMVFVPKCSNCGAATELRCAASTCRKTICQECFRKDSKCPFCNGNKLVSIKKNK